MAVSTEQIRDLRDTYRRHLNRSDSAPQTVQDALRVKIQILNEVLEYREAEESTERGEILHIQIPVKGTVS